ncbi:hypothetical protein AAY473_038838 [Plecturocebus cupreus]
MSVVQVPTGALPSGAVRGEPSSSRPQKGRSMISFHRAPGKAVGTQCQPVKAAAELPKAVEAHLLISMLSTKHLQMRKMTRRIMKRPKINGKEVSAKVLQGCIILVKVEGHGQVHVGGVELQVDVDVDGGLTAGVNSDMRKSRLQIFQDAKNVCCKADSLAGSWMSSTHPLRT